MSTTLSRGTMLVKLTQTLKEENALLLVQLRLVVDDTIERRGADGVRQTIADVRTGRVNSILVETGAAPPEMYFINHFARSYLR